MKDRYTYNESSKILGTVDFPAGLTKKEELTVYYWAVFKKRRFYKFVWNVGRGEGIWTSFNKAKTYQVFDR